MCQPPEQPYPAQRPTLKEPHLPQEEVPTQRLPRVKMSMQQLSTQEMVDAGPADPAAADTEKTDGEKELAEDEPHGAQDCRTRVEEAQLTDDVREAAPREVRKLERTGEQGAESGDIETWLDTMFDGTDRAAFLLDELLDGAPRSGVPMPYSANTPHRSTIPPDAQPQSPTDLEIEEKIRSLIQGAREPDPPAADTEKVDTDTVDPAAADTEMVDREKVDPTLTGEIAWPVPPWAADAEMVDVEKVDPAAAEVEKADTAPAGHDDDTVEMPAVLAGLSEGPHPPQITPQVHGPVPVQNPVEKRRFGSLALAVTALAALIIGALLFGASRDDGTISPHRYGDPDPDRDGDYSVGEFGRLCQALPNRSNRGYTSRWSRYFSAGAALGGRRVDIFPAAYEDRPVWPFHRLYRVRAAGSVPASRAGPRLRPDV
jgi:hypothetical protein